jgi:hypothetical protein
MTDERPCMLKLKKGHLEQIEGIAERKLLNVRISTSLDRVQAFKEAVSKSSWYYSLMKRMI